MHFLDFDLQKKQAENMEERMSVMGKGRRSKEQKAARKQMELPKRRWGWRLWGFFGTMAMLAVIVLTIVLACARGEKTAVVHSAIPQKQKPVPLLSPVFSRYLARHDAFPRKHWLPDDLSEKEMLFRVGQQEKKISSLLQKHRSVSPLSEEIYKHLGDFRVSLFHQGISKTPMIDNRFDPARPYGDLEICLIPEDQGSHPDLKETFTWYHREWSAVMQRDDICPDALLAAILYHEMGHALLHKQDAASSRAPTMSDSWIEEEVRMHTLEDQILDASSAGRLKLLYDSIIIRVLKDASLETIMAEVTESDLDAYDKLLSLQQESERMASISLAQFQIGLLLRAVDLLPFEQKPAKKLAAYRWVASQSM